MVIQQRIKLFFLVSCCVFAFSACSESKEKKVSKPRTIAMIKDNARGIINNTNSPNVKLKSIDIGDCQWTEGFWAEKWKQAEETMVPYMGELLKGDTGHGLNNFKIAAGLKEGEHKGWWWHDGDFYKWMEACMYIYAVNKNEKIVRDMDEIIDII